MSSSPIFISAGEASGDMYAAQLAKALAARGHANLFGMGGPRMEEAGVELIARASDVTVSGVIEVLGKVPTIGKTLRLLTDEAAKRKPNLAVLTDFPGFHLRLARILKAHGIPCVYFVAPQFWAWRPWRARLVKRRFAKALCIFPFEEDFYRKAGVDATFIGHPLVDSVKPSISREQFLAKCELDPQRPVVALLPGSRMNERIHNLPVMLKAAEQIARELPGTQFVQALPAEGQIEPIPGAQRPRFPIEEIHLNDLRISVPKELGLRTAIGETYDALSAADLAIVASGTATVETALLDTPMVVVYRVASLTSLVLRALVTTPYFAMPNLIAGRKVVPELFQADTHPERIARESLRLLQSPEARTRMRADLADVRSRLGPGGAIERAAEIIAAMAG